MNIIRRKKPDGLVIDSVRNSVWDAVQDNVKHDVWRSIKDDGVWYEVEYEMDETVDDIISPIQEYILNELETKLQ